VRHELLQGWEKDTAPDFVALTGHGDNGQGRPEDSRAAQSMNQEN